MEMKAVESSNISAVGHDGADLYVEFKTGATYKYVGVPVDVYESILNAESVGKFLNAEIKPVFPFEKV